MVTRRLVISARDVVFAKGIVEALDGVAAVFAERGGDLVLASPIDREAELDQLARDLAMELGGVMEMDEDATPQTLQEPQKQG